MITNCKECGQAVSDKATVCPNCGAPIVRKVICDECGQEMPATVDACPNCGCPNAKKGNTDVKAHPVLTNCSEGTNKRVQRFLIENRKNLPQSKFEEIRKQLFVLNEQQWESVELVSFKDPTLLLVLSILVGEFGVDRFILGDIKNGVFKLLLTLCCGVGVIWWIIDLFKINEMTLNYNYRLLKDTFKYV